MSETISENLSENMTAEKFNQIEREIQLGTRTQLPDGREIADVQKSLAELQMAQEKERLAAVGSGGDVALAAATERLVEVTVHENGVLTARPVVEAVEIDVEQETAASDLPSDFPMREQLIAAGFGTLETVAKFGKESLVGITGIGEKSADKILAYGKSE